MQPKATGPMTLSRIGSNSENERLNRSLPGEGQDTAVALAFTVGLWNVPSPGSINSAASVFGMKGSPKSTRRFFPSAVLSSAGTAYNNSEVILLETLRVSHCYLTSTECIVLLCSTCGVAA